MTRPFRAFKNDEDGCWVWADSEADVQDVINDTTEIQIGTITINFTPFTPVRIVDMSDQFPDTHPAYESTKRAGDADAKGIGAIEQGLFGAAGWWVGGESYV